MEGEGHFSHRSCLYQETGAGECIAHHVVVSLSGNMPVQYCSILVPMSCGYIENCSPEQ